MKQEMIDLLKKKNKISDKDADEVLALDESEIIDFLTCHVKAKFIDIPANLD